jgi:hypothetical protein
MFKNLQKMSTDFPDWYQAELNSTADDTSVRQTIAKPHVVGRSGQTGPHDRYRQTAAFICGYCSIPSERVEDLAEIIRRDAKQDKPYELAHCKKCDTDVEIEFSEPDDEECSYPHFYCPKCYANYYDRQAKESWPELDDHYEEIRERYMESQFDDDDW